MKRRCQIPKTKAKGKRERRPEQQDLHGKVQYRSLMLSKTSRPVGFLVLPAAQRGLTLTSVASPTFVSCYSLRIMDFPAFMTCMDTNPYFSHTCAERRRPRYSTPSESNSNDEHEGGNSRHKGEEIYNCMAETGKRREAVYIFYRPALTVARLHFDIQHKEENLLNLVKESFSTFEILICPSGTTIYTISYSDQSSIASLSSSFFLVGNAALLPGNKNVGSLDGHSVRGGLDIDSMIDLAPLKDINGSTWDEMLIKVRDLIGEIYREHRYLAPFLEQNAKTEFDLIASKDPTYQSLDTALQKLSRYLDSYHKSKCVVLIDEYDAPIHEAYNTNNGSYYETALKFFQTLFSSLLKDNTYLHKAFLVGVLRIVKSGFLSSLNNICVYPMGSSKYANKFGFTEGEVALLCKLHKVDTPMDDVRSWYSGYRSGEHSSLCSLYNPWSVIRLCETKKLDMYWKDTGGRSWYSVFFSLNSFEEDQVHIEFVFLLDNKPIQALIRDDIRYENLANFNDDTLWTLLYYTGYLTPDVRGLTTPHYTIPNYEVYMQWVEWVMPALSESTTCKTLLHTLVSGNINDFKEMFERTVMESLSYYDVGGESSGKHAECFYHAFVLGMFIHVQNYNYKVRSNRERGMGRYDICLEPVATHLPLAILIEFKVTNETETIESAAQKGLDQIEKKRYNVGLPVHVKQLVELGIGFKGKQVCVMGKKLTLKQRKFVGGRDERGRNRRPTAPERCNYKCIAITTGWDPSPKEEQQENFPDSNRERKFATIGLKVNET
ncbi:hypothetical protein BC938DRAFT_478277 [Jimgerdemannia flammicorona]|uniref:AAA-ATPase-like domain-containing protein n=1 Tax=Jimgerdemannia flammicorona TaxID=994334 RepID=A0A433QN55_9FUNG|nr:hypothetical protein BC938DRAFT_478277 [Jimgerdemannia flammicorona]